MNRCTINFPLNPCARMRNPAVEEPVAMDGAVHRRAGCRGGAGAGGLVPDGRYV